MNRDLKKIMDKIKIDKEKDFSNLPLEERLSILRICRYIGDILGYDSISVESQNSDIEFKDKEDYFLEVKTLFYFRGKYGDKHTRAMNKLMVELESRKSRFISGFVDRKNNLEIISDNKKRGIKNDYSTGNIMFEYKYISSKDIYGKLRTLINKAMDQLDNIDDPGRKIIAIDISYYLLDGLRLRKQLQEWLGLNPEIGERVDGICLFSLDHQRKGGLIYPLTISTQRLKECVKSKVFRQNIHHQDVRFNLQTIINKKFDEKSIFMDDSGKVHADAGYFRDLFRSSLDLKKQDANIPKDEGIDRMGFYFDKKKKKKKK